MVSPISRASDDETAKDPGPYRHTVGSWILLA